jgi:hypothetical protein
MRRGKEKEEELREKVEELLREGKTYKQIRRELRVSPNTIAKVKQGLLASKTRKTYTAQRPPQQQSVKPRFNPPPTRHETTKLGLRPHGSKAEDAVRRIANHYYGYGYNHNSYPKTTHPTTKKKEQSPPQQQSQPRTSEPQPTKEEWEDILRDRLRRQQQTKQPPPQRRARSAWIHTPEEVMAQAFDMLDDGYDPDEVRRELCIHHRDWLKALDEYRRYEKEVKEAMTGNPEKHKKEQEEIDLVDEYNKAFMKAAKLKMQLLAMKQTGLLTD